MVKKTINKFISNLSSKEKSEFKRIYKYINNISTVDWELTKISNFNFKKIKKLSDKKLKGKDISFELGFKYFRNVKIFLKKGVFVPQYDTEAIIDLLPKAQKGQTLLEIGSGTGVIAICSNLEKGYKTTSLDINKKATKISIKNAIESKADVNFINQDFFTYEPIEKFNILISNPPYIDTNDKNLEEWVKDNQPKNALYADNDGFFFYQKIILNHEKYIKKDGILIFEIGYDQAEQIKN